MGQQSFDAAPRRRQPRLQSSSPTDRDRTAPGHSSDGSSCLPECSRPQRRSAPPRPAPDHHARPYLVRRRPALPRCREPGPARPAFILKISFNKDGNRLELAGQITAPNWCPDLTAAWPSHGPIRPRVADDSGVYGGSAICPPRRAELGRAKAKPSFLVGSGAARRTAISPPGVFAEFRSKWRMQFSTLRGGS